MILPLPNKDVFDINSILFRAKSILSKEWIYGWIFINSFFPYIKDIKDIDGIETKIDITSLGIFTGLYDFKNEKIFTGDIISNSRYNNKHLIISTNGSFNALSLEEYELIYNNKMLNLSDSSKLTNNWIQECKKEIIGNIYDNPNLFNKE